MELVQDLGTVRDPQGKFHSKGIFACGFCGTTVERWFYAGHRDQSCGCSRRRITGEKNSTHGLYKYLDKEPATVAVRSCERTKSLHPLVVVWGGMKSRCYRKSHAMFAYYGGRGIRVCDEWLNDVAAFVEWSLSHGWSAGLQIDRIDNDGDYSPANCRYITCCQNNRNSRQTKLTPQSVIEMRHKHATGGVSYAELSRLYGITRGAARSVVIKKTWADIGD
jgi:hypothetical protein